MSTHRPSAAGGVVVAIGAIGGAATGFVLGEPTAWFFAGTAAGIVAALLVWWRTAR